MPGAFYKPVTNIMGYDSITCLYESSQFRQESLLARACPAPVLSLGIPVSSRLPGEAVLNGSLAGTVGLSRRLCLCLTRRSLPGLNLEPGANGAFFAFRIAQVEDVTIYLYELVFHRPHPGT
jgi:hypothetical protein